MNVDDFQRVRWLYERHKHLVNFIEVLQEEPSVLSITARHIDDTGNETAAAKLILSRRFNGDILDRVTATLADEVAEEIDLLEVEMRGLGLEIGE